MTLKEMIADAIDKAADAQGEVHHAHVRCIDLASLDDPLPCGSQFFFTINRQFTLGFDRAQLLWFRDNVNEGIAAALSAHPVSPTNENAPCIGCGLVVTSENGFPTIVGWMHFECKDENK